MLAGIRLKNRARDEMLEEERSQSKLIEEIMEDGKRKCKTIADVKPCKDIYLQFSLPNKRQR